MWKSFQVRYFLGSKMNIFSKKNLLKLRSLSNNRIRENLSMKNIFQIYSQCNNQKVQLTQNHQNHAIRIHYSDNPSLDPYRFRNIWFIIGENSCWNEVGMKVSIISQFSKISLSSFGDVFSTASFSYADTYIWRKFEGLAFYEERILSCFKIRM